MTDDAQEPQGFQQFINTLNTVSFGSFTNQVLWVVGSLSLTFLDVWLAVQATGGTVLLPIHRLPNMACPIGRRVRPLLTEAFGGAEAALHQVLATTTLDRLTKSLGP